MYFSQAEWQAILDEVVNSDGAHPSLSDIKEGSPGHVDDHILIRKTLFYYGMVTDGKIEKTNGTWAFHEDNRTGDSVEEMPDLEELQGAIDYMMMIGNILVGPSDTLLPVVEWPDDYTITFYTGGITKVIEEAQRQINRAMRLATAMKTMAMPMYNITNHFGRVDEDGNLYWSPSVPEEGPDVHFTHSHDDAFVSNAWLSKEDDYVQSWVLKDWAKA